MAYIRDNVSNKYRVTPNNVDYTSPSSFVPRQQFFSDTNDPYAINSAVDAIFNTAGKIKRYGGIGAVPLIGDVIGAVDVLYTTGIKPIIGNIHQDLTDNNKNTNLWTGLGSGIVQSSTNALINLSETMDILSNPIKGMFLEPEGPLQGLVKGLGMGPEGRKTYNYDVKTGSGVGNWLTDFGLEVISDPLNWISFGGAGAIKAGAKSVVKKAVSEAGQEVGETAIKRMSRTLTNVVKRSTNLSDITTDAVKTAASTVGQRGIVNRLANTFNKSDMFADAYTKTNVSDTVKVLLSNPRTVEAGRRLAREEATQSFSKVLADKISQGILEDTKAIKLGHKVYRFSEGVQQGLARAAGVTVPLYLTGKATKKAFSLGRELSVAKTLNKFGRVNLADFSAMKNAIDTKTTDTLPVEMQAIVKNPVLVERLGNQTAEQEIVFLTNMEAAYRKVAGHVQDELDDALKITPEDILLERRAAASGPTLFKEDGSLVNNIDSILKNYGPGKVNDFDALFKTNDAIGSNTITRVSQIVDTLVKEMDIPFINYPSTRINNFEEYYTFIKGQANDGVIAPKYINFLDDFLHLKEYAQLAEESFRVNKVLDISHQVSKTLHKLSSSAYTHEQTLQVLDRLSTSVKRSLDGFTNNVGRLLSESSATEAHMLDLEKFPEKALIEDGLKNDISIAYKKFTDATDNYKKNDAYKLRLAKAKKIYDESADIAYRKHAANLQALDDMYADFPGAKTKEAVLRHAEIAKHRALKDLEVEYTNASNRLVDQHERFLAATTKEEREAVLTQFKREDTKRVQDITVKTKEMRAKGFNKSKPAQYNKLINTGKNYIQETTKKFYDVNAIPKELGYLTQDYKASIYSINMEHAVRLSQIEQAYLRNPFSELSTNLLDSMIGKLEYPIAKLHETLFGKKNGLLKKFNLNADETLALSNKFDTLMLLIRRAPDQLDINKTPVYLEFKNMLMYYDTQNANALLKDAVSDLEYGILVSKKLTQGINALEELGQDTMFARSLNYRRLKSKMLQAKQIAFAVLSEKNPRKVEALTQRLREQLSDLTPLNSRGIHDKYKIAKAFIDESETVVGMKRFEGELPYSFNARLTKEATERARKAGIIAEANLEYTTSKAAEAFEPITNIKPLVEDVIERRKIINKTIRSIESMDFNGVLSEQSQEHLTELLTLLKHAKTRAGGGVEEADRAYVNLYNWMQSLIKGLDTSSVVKDVPVFQKGDVVAKRLFDAALKDRKTPLTPQEIADINTLIDSIHARNEARNFGSGLTEKPKYVRPAGSPEPTEPKGKYTVSADVLERDPDATVRILSNEFGNGESVYGFIKELPELYTRGGGPAETMINLIQDLNNKAIRYVVTTPKTYITQQLLSIEGFSELASLYSSKLFNGKRDNSGLAEFIQVNAEKIPEMAQLGEKLQQFDKYFNLVQKIDSLDILQPDHKLGLIDSLASFAGRDIIGIDSYLEETLKEVFDKTNLNTMMRHDAMRYKSDVIVDNVIADAENFDKALQPHVKNIIALKEAGLHDADNDVDTLLELMHIYPEMAPKIEVDEYAVFFDMEASGKSKGSDVLQLSASDSTGKKLFTKKYAKAIDYPSEEVLLKLYNPDTKLTSVVAHNKALIEARAIFDAKFRTEGLPSEDELIKDFMRTIKAAAGNKKLVLVGQNIEEFDVEILRGKVSHMSAEYVSVFDNARLHDTYIALMLAHGVKLLTADQKQTIHAIIANYVNELMEAGLKDFVSPADKHTAHLLRKIGGILRGYVAVGAKAFEAEGALLDITSLESRKGAVASANKLTDMGNEIGDILKDKGIRDERYMEDIGMINLSKLNTNVYNIMSVLLENVHGVSYFGAYKYSDPYDVFNIFDANKLVEFEEIGDLPAKTANMLTNYARKIQKRAEYVYNTDKIHDFMATKLMVQRIYDKLKAVSLPSPLLHYLKDPADMYNDALGFMTLVYMYENAYRKANIGSAFEEQFLKTLTDTEQKAFTTVLNSSYLYTSVKDTESFFKAPDTFASLQITTSDMTEALEKAMNDPLVAYDKLLVDRGLQFGARASYRSYLEPLYKSWDAFKNKIAPLTDDAKVLLKGELSSTTQMYHDLATNRILSETPQDLLAQMYLSGGRKVIEVPKHMYIPQTHLDALEEVGIKTFRVDTTISGNDTSMYLLLVDGTRHQYVDLPKTYTPKFVNLSGTVKDSEISEIITDMRGKVNAQTELVAGADKSIKSFGLGDSDGSLLTEAAFEKFDALVPDAAKEFLIPLDQLHEADYFATGIMHPNHMYYGKFGVRNYFNEYAAMNPMKTYTNTSYEFVKNSDGIVRYLHMYENSEMRLDTSPYFKDLTADTLYQMLKNNEDYTVTFIHPCTKATKTASGFIAEAVKVTSPKIAQMMKDNGAIIVPHNIYRTLSSTFNDYQLSPVMKIARAAAMTYKAGYLGSIGFLIRNLLDGFTKNTITADSPLELPRVVNHWFETCKLYYKYNKQIENFTDLGFIKSGVLGKHYKYNDIKKVGEVVPQIGISVDEAAIKAWFKVNGTSEQAELFLVVHNFIANGPSAGLAKGLEDELFTAAAALKDDTTFDKVIKRYGKFVGDIPVLKQLRNTNSMIEQTLRLSTYLQSLGEGKTVNSAISDVIRAHFDYADKTLIQTYTDIVFPFLSFSMKNLEYYAKAVSSKGWLIPALVDYMTPIWDFDSWTTEDAAMYQGLDRKIDWENEINFQTTTPWMQVNAARVAAALSGNIFYDTGRMATYHNQYSDKDEERKVYQTFKLNPSFVDAVKYLTNPLDVNSFDGTLQTRALPPYDMLFNIASNLLGGSMTTTDAELGLNMYDAPLVGSVMQRYGINFNSQKSPAQKAKDAGNILPMLSSVSGVSYVKEPFDYNKYYAAQAYYKKYNKPKTKFSGLRGNYTYSRYRSLYDNRYTTIPEHIRQTNNLTRIIQSGSKDIYAKSGYNKLEGLMTPITTTNLKYKVNMMRNRVRDKYYYL